MIHYTLDQILSFALTAEHGSFVKAARASGKDRTTISEHVNNLEIALNTNLFERGNNKLVITEQGQLLLRWSRALIRHAQGLQTFADSLSVSDKTHFRIAIDLHLSNDFILDTDMAVRDVNPNIVVDWIYRNRADSLEDLVNQSIDAAIVLRDEFSLKSMPRGELTACYLGEVRGKLYTGVDSPLKALSPVNFSDLIGSIRYFLQSSSEIGIGERASYSGRQVVLHSVELIEKFIEKDGWAYLPSSQSLESNPKITTLEANFLNSHWPMGHFLMSRSDMSGRNFHNVLESIKKMYRQFYS
ncbi:LysR family transcriptional regulator [Vibrio zhanjiangensis]|uniref:LysR family transcriptional regulator n=1 Tax=Vibrio zhanjiangensis TaxID=1046128 RepID=A0ABQ6F003_9VIBR|nr:LysR family transcriptional regulator [Vibrio zhanjiangensis]GLT18818.1 LysR family transcriptional regulator [Vibrio zhanjiangensis]